ncbi:hypothetical protein BURK_004132 [Burkholderia sp. SJ98]|nr:hypothetical protein BURK_004132 [Burkholderia sp. SJ98]
MIEAQSERLGVQVRAGADTTATRTVLYCLARSLTALEASKAAMAVDLRVFIRESLAGVAKKSNND